MTTINIKSFCGLQGFNSQMGQNFVAILLILSLMPHAEAVRRILLETDGAALNTCRATAQVVAMQNFCAFYIVFHAFMIGSSRYAEQGEQL